MNNLWHIHDAPLWLVVAFMFDGLPGLRAQSPEGVLTIEYAIHPNQNIIEFMGLVPPTKGGLLDEPIRTKTARFRVDHEHHRLDYVKPTEPGELSCRSGGMV